MPKVKLTTRVDQAIEQLEAAKAEFAKPESERDYAKAVGHSRLAQALIRRFKDYVMNREVDEIRSEA